MLATGDVPVQYGVLSDGFRGTDETVATMGELAMGRFGARSPKIRALARNIIDAAHVKEKDYDAEAAALGRWVRDNIRYMRDVYGQETLSQPEDTAFNMRAGDCDDQATLLAALLGAAGIPSRFKVMGVTPWQYSHVYLQAKPRGQWITMDPIMSDKPIGWEVPVARRAIEKVYPTNLPKGGAMNGLGYVSPLEAAPPKPAIRPSYVSMPSNLDTDAPLDHMMRYPPNQNVPQHYPQQRATWRGPVMRPDQALPARPQDEGRFDVMTPDRMEGVGLAANMDQVQPAEAYPNMRPILQRPEGIDLQFVRAAQVFDPNQDDKIWFEGAQDLQQRPPIRPITSLEGDLEASMLPGMGVINGAGPGLALGATGNELPAEAPSPTPILAQSAMSPMGKLALGAIALGGLYFLTRSKSKKRRRA